MTETKPPCPHCDGALAMMTAAQASALASAVPIEPSLRASRTVYEARLERCVSCAALQEEVLCAWCGCFVQFRARSRAGYCPHPAGDKWRGV